MKNCAEKANKIIAKQKALRVQLAEHFGITKKLAENITSLTVDSSEREMPKIRLKAMSYIRELMILEGKREYTVRFTKNLYAVNHHLVRRWKRLEALKEAYTVMLNAIRWRAF